MRAGMRRRRIHGPLIIELSRFADGILFRARLTRPRRVRGVGVWMRTWTVDRAP